MNIRVYKIEDKDSCLEIFKSNQPKYFNNNELEDFTLWLNEQEDDRYFVLENSGIIIGCGGYFIDDENTAGLSWGMILSTEHKKGYGKILTEFRLKKISEQASIKKTRLDTCQHTHKFYEKMGFSVIQIIKDGYSKGLDKYDMVKMQGK